MFLQANFVAHTAPSKLLVEDRILRDLMGLIFDKCWPSANRSFQTNRDTIALRCEDPHTFGFALANATCLTTFEFLVQNPSRAESFTRVMSSTSTTSLNVLGCQRCDSEGHDP